MNKMTALTLSSFILTFGFCSVSKGMIGMDLRVVYRNMCSSWRESSLDRNGMFDRDPVRGSILVLAAMGGDTELVEEILKGISDLRLGEVLLNHYHGNSYNPCIKLQRIIGGQDPRPYEETALLIAAQMNKDITPLLKFKVNVNAKDDNSLITALMVAASNGCVPNVRLLLTYKADVTLEDRDGKTAIDYAKENGNNAVVALLTSQAALPNQDPNPYEVSFQEQASLPD